jgi:hypothetical protein
MLSKAGTSLKGTVNQARLASIVQLPSRRFAGGGPKKPPMPATETDFDIVFVGGVNATAVMKFL